MPRPLVLSVRALIVLAAFVLAAIIVHVLGRDALAMVHRMAHPRVNPEDRLRSTITERWQPGWGTLDQVDPVSNCFPGPAFATCAAVTTREGLTFWVTSPDGTTDLRLALPFALNNWRPALALQVLADQADQRPLPDGLGVPGLQAHRLTRVPDRHLGPLNGLVVLNGTVMTLAQDDARHPVPYLLVIAPWSLLVAAEKARMGVAPGPEDVHASTPFRAGMVFPLAPTPALHKPSPLEQTDNASDLVIQSGPVTISHESPR